MRSVPLLSVLVSLVLLPLSGPASGQYVGPGSGPAGNTVAAVTGLPDDTPIVLEGYIVKQLYRKRYVFRDATGEIHVEIDDKAWMGHRVGPETRVRITGKTERNWWVFGSNEIEVKWIEVLAAGSPPAGGGVQPPR